VEILLRRASSLEQACETAAQAIVTEFELEPDLRFSAYAASTSDDNIGSQLHGASTTAMHRLRDVLALYEAKAKIRALIGQANAAAISPLLAEREHYLKAAKKTLATYLAMNRHLECEHDAVAVTVKLAGIRRRLQTVTTGSVNDTVRVPKLSIENVATIHELEAELQRRQLDLNDEIAKQNLSIKITLPDTVVAVLLKHKIIARDGA
jgi:hypothetical protein